MIQQISFLSSIELIEIHGKIIFECFNAEVLDKNKTPIDSYLNLECNQVVLT